MKRKNIKYYQGRSKKQVEGTQKILFYSLIFGTTNIDMTKTAKENYIKINLLLYPTLNLKLRNTISKNTVGCTCTFDLFTFLFTLYSPS